MQELEQRSFVHEGRNFMSKLYSNGNRFEVVVFLNGQQVSPRYGVDLETDVDYFMQHREHLTNHLFEIAKSDIKQGLYPQS